MSFLFINKILRLNDLKNIATINAESGEIRQKWDVIGCRRVQDSECSGNPIFIFFIKEFTFAQWLDGNKWTTHGRHLTQTHYMDAHAVYERCKSRELVATFNKQCMCISYKLIKSQWSNLAKSTFLQSLPVAVPLPSHYDTKSFTTVALDIFGNADRNSLSERKQGHGAALIVFQVKLSIMKLKPTMSSKDISAIKNLEKLKCQQIVSFHQNQSLLLESTFFIGQEQYTNLQIADNLVENTDIVPSWVSVILPDL